MKFSSRDQALVDHGIYAEKARAARMLSQDELRKGCVSAAQFALITARECATIARLQLDVVRAHDEIARDFLNRV